MQLIVGHRGAARGPGTRQTHQMFGADVGREDRCPDDKKPKVAAGKKIIRGVILCLSNHPPCETEDKQKVYCNNNPIQCLHHNAFSSFFYTVSFLSPASSHKL